MLHQQTLCSFEGKQQCGHDPVAPVGGRTAKDAEFVYVTNFIYMVDSMSDQC